MYNWVDYWEKPKRKNGAFSELWRALVLFALLALLIPVVAFIFIKGDIQRRWRIKRGQYGETHQRRIRL